MGSGKGGSYPLCCITYNNVYTDDINHHLQATGVGCYVGGAWVNSLSYADDIVSLAPTVTALQTVLDVCRAYAGPHDIVYNTTKTVCVMVSPKQLQGRFSIRVRLGNEWLSFVEEFCFLGQIMTTDCRDDKDIKKQFRRQNAVGNMPVRKLSFAPIEAKIQLSKSYCYPIYGCALWRHSFQNSKLENLLSVIVTHSSVLLTSPDTPARVRHLRWTQLTIYQCGVTQICLQLDEQSSSFPPTVLLLPLSIAMHIITLQWWISGRVCYMYRSDHR